MSTPPTPGRPADQFSMLEPRGPNALSPDRTGWRVIELADVMPPERLTLLPSRAPASESDGGAAIRPVRRMVSRFPSRQPDSARMAIANFIVREYLQHDEEVVYLASGSTVYQVAVALVNAVERGEKHNVKVVLTDSLAIIDLFFRRAPRSPRLQSIQFAILGGTADYSTAGIRLAQLDHARLDQWAVTTAIVSATGIDPATGTITSFHELDSKKWISHHANRTQVIIPIEPEKLAARSGSRIPQPTGEGPPGQQEYHIVTSEVDASVCEQLQRFGYTVRRVRPLESGGFE